MIQRPDLKLRVPFCDACLDALNLSPAGNVRHTHERCAACFAEGPEIETWSVDVSRCQLKVDGQQCARPAGHVAGACASERTLAALAAQADEYEVLLKQTLDPMLEGATAALAAVVGKVNATRTMASARARIEQEVRKITSLDILRQHQEYCASSLAEWRTKMTTVAYLELGIFFLREQFSEKRG